ncbi:hypothetical protein DL96DRAFT_1648901 [Flagelloscypha sp. PMI_526]|nr:hypothetical protein DL96DRAFT_1648901 [Flagelloscypha sp. PMI_526]
MQALSNLDHDVKRLNELIRNASTSHGASTRWHFDLRFSTLQPPGHLLWLFNFTSKETYAQSLPAHNVNKPSESISWFPELAAEAAPDITYALVHAFLQLNKTKGLIPTKIFTDGPPLAIEVAKELKRIGVVDSFCNIGTTTDSRLSAVDLAFEKYFQDLPGNRRGLITAPQGVRFSTPPPQAMKWTMGGGKRNSDIVLKVANQIINSISLDSRKPADAQKASAGVLHQINALNARFEETIDKDRTLAEDNDAEGTIYYALRLVLWYGIGVPQNRSECRTYLCKVLFHCPAVTAPQKIVACCLLMDWHFDNGSGPIRSRDLNATAHFADVAAALVPKGKLVPSVLAFGTQGLSQIIATVPELQLQYHHLWSAVRDRDTEIAEETQKSEVKRLKAPLRYQCAKQDCPITADSGRMLRQCAGRCDADKKPSYCGKECAFFYHKPYCRPGAECSVLEKVQVFPQGQATRGGSVAVPLTLPGGRHTMVSTSTFGAERMKEFKNEFEKLVRERE